MHVSAKLAQQTKLTIAAWNSQPASQTAAIDCFVGDIYRGLRANDLSTAERTYANQHLYILSGLYGLLKANDGIMPYRLEMAYRLPSSGLANLYQFWGDSVARALPTAQPIINLCSVEYAKLVLPYLKPDKLISPQFLTIDPSTGQPVFVAVHAKVARGAMARWLIQQQLKEVDQLTGFDRLGYRFEPTRSKPNQPTFVCQQFGGLGLKA